MKYKGNKVSIQRIRAKKGPKIEEVAGQSNQKTQKQ
jgi:hypothetical protein